MPSTNSNSINSKILDIKQRLQNGEDPIKLLNKAFDGQTALIVSAGPSCSRWREVYEKLLTEKKQVLVITIKQALDVVGDLSHFHFLNSGNLKKYQHHPGCISIFTRNSINDVVFGKYDIEFKVMEELDREAFYLARTNFYDAYELNKTGKYRPPGPGVMHESVFHTLVHMGIKHIETIGWDIANDNGINVHFDDNHGVLFHQTGLKFTLKHWMNQLGLLKVAKYINKFVSTATCFYKFHTGRRINKSGMFLGEAELVSSSIPKLANWLERNFIFININSDSVWFK